MKPNIRLNFLLGNSDADLDNFRLMRMNAIADLRKELHAVLDTIIDEMTQAALAAWFVENDRATLKAALENEGSVLEWANRMIRGEHDVIPRVVQNLGEAGHRIAAATYQKRNLAAGKCASCPRPLARNSVKYCEEHLAKARVRQRTKKGLSDPGSREYLYAGEVSQDGRGRAPGQLARLAMYREQKTRGLLADLGIAPESAAVSLKAAKDALLQHMPDQKGLAMTQTELFERAVIPSKTTGQKALNALLSTGQIERTGKGVRNDPFAYFVAPG